VHGEIVACFPPYWIPSVWLISIFYYHQWYWSAALVHRAASTSAQRLPAAYFRPPCEHILRLQTLAAEQSAQRL
jgi:hypothetical protein